MTNDLARLRALLEAERQHHEQGANVARHEESRIAAGLHIAIQHLDTITRPSEEPP